MLLSVIVPTRNRLGSLKRLMESFDAARIPENWEVEIVVVDNDSNDGTHAWLRHECERKRNFRLSALRETNPGKASAVNLGLSKSRGDVILIVDDDVVVHPLCFIKHVECYSVTSFDAAQGRVLPGVDRDGRPADPKKLREYNIPIVDYGEAICEIRGLLATNVSFKRAVFEKVGFYDARLGVGASGFGEDTEFSMRLRKAGFKTGYTPHPVVYHELNPERYGRGYNRMAQYRKGVSRNFYRQDSIVFGVLPNLLVNCVRFGLYSVLGMRQKAYKTEGRILKYWGYLMGKAHGAKNRGLDSKL